jgi:hypothetical protein
MTFYNIKPSGPVTILLGSVQQFTNSTKDGKWTADDVTVAVVDIGGLVSGIRVGSTTLKYWVGDQFKTCQIIVE